MSNLRYRILSATRPKFDLVGLHSKFRKIATTLANIDVNAANCLGFQESTVNVLLGWTQVPVINAVQFTPGAFFDGKLF